jgi:aryl-alcohol dehydrogenase-like predicted oxidoreductase
MHFRQLGRTEIAVSEMGYGAWGIGGRQWVGGDDAQSLAALRRAFEMGLNFIDTALAYNEGHSEKLVGAAAREAGHAVTIATKIPPKNRVWPAQPGVGIEEVFPFDYIVASTEESLRNLGVEQIDLQQFHVWNPEWLAAEDWRRGIETLKASGKVKHFGISINDHQPGSALSLIETGMIDTVQVIFNIFDPTPAAELLPLCAARNIGVLARCPLDEGALTGAITEETVFAPGEFREMYFGGDRKRQVVERVAALRADLADVPGSLAEIALRWVLSHPEVSSVIPGMRQVKNVEANIAASERGPLPAEVMERLRRHAWAKNFSSAV